MEEYMAALAQAFADYRRDLDEFERKRKPTDGLLGFGRSLQDDPCHERFDGRLEEAVRGVCALPPSPGEAARAARLLLEHNGEGGWPLAAQWMLRAIERHALPLIPYLSAEDAAALLRQYAARYKPWDRLPAQKQVHKALSARAKASPENHKKKP